MENQKIQQLVKLAYIADTNGDYKIADKIFEKLAATPPPRQVLFRRTPEEVLKFIKTLSSNIFDLDDKLANLTKLDKKYKSGKFDSWLPTNHDTVLDMYYEYFKAKRNLPNLKTVFETERTKNRPNSPEYKKAKKDYDEADGIVKQGKEFFDDLTGPPLSQEAVVIELQKIKGKLDKIAPEDVSILPSNNPERILIEKLKAYFQLLGLDAKQIERRELKPFTEDIGTQEKTVRKDNPKKGTSTETKTNKKIKKVNIWSTISNLNAISAPFVQKQLYRFTTIRDAISDVKQPSAIKAIYDDTKEFIDKVRGNNPSTLIQPLSEQLETLVARYNYVFYQAFNGAYEELYELRNKQILDAQAKKPGGSFYTGSATNVPDPFDVKNQADLSAVIKLAQEKVANMPEGLLIRTLFETIEQEMKTEIVRAKENLVIKEKKPTVDNIYTEIKTANPNFYKNVGFDENDFRTIIEKEGVLSFDEFIKIKANKSKRLKSANWEIVKLIAYPASQLALTYVIILQAKKYLYDPYLGKVLGWGVDKASGADARRDREKEIKEINPPSAGQTQDSIRRLQEEMRDTNRNQDFTPTKRN